MPGRPFGSVRKDGTYHAQPEQVLEAPGRDSRGTFMASNAASIAQGLLPGAGARRPCREGLATTNICCCSVMSFGLIASPQTKRISEVGRTIRNARAGYASTTRLLPSTRAVYRRSSDFIRRRTVAWWPGWRGQGDTTWLSLVWAGAQIVSLSRQCSLFRRWRLRIPWAAPDRSASSALHGARTAFSRVARVGTR